MIIFDADKKRVTDNDTGVIYYRGDINKPYGENTICGGKVIQARELLYKNKSHIIENCNSTVVGQTSVHSTSGTILAAVAQELGFKCIVIVGGSNDKCLFTKNYMMRLAKHYGADVRNVCGTGMSGPVMHRLRELCKERNYFNACYSDNYDDVIPCISKEVICIPNELDNLIIPVGSGINMSAILSGIRYFGKKVKRVIGCHVGPDRSDKILEMCNPLLGSVKFEMQPLNTVYSKPEYCVLPDGTQLDELYEAKAHKWMTENIDTKKEKTLFWIVGKRPTIKEVNMLLS